MSENSDHSSDDQASTSTTPSGGDNLQGKGDTSRPVLIAQKDAKFIVCTRLLLLLALTVAAAVVGFSAFFVTDQEENYDFETQFSDFANDVIDVSHHNAKTVFKAVEGLSMDITSAALLGNQSFPFVTTPHLEARGRLVGDLSGALSIGYSPVVQSEERQRWEMYSVEHQGWIQEALSLDSHEGDDSNETPPAEEIYPMIHHTNSGETPHPELGEGPYAPLWQVVPAPHHSEHINFNLFSLEEYKKVFNLVAALKLPKMSGVVDWSFLAEDHAKDEFLRNPTSLLVEPVFDEFDSGRSIKGSIFALLAWDVYFSNLLPQDVQGIVCVLRNTCGQEFTYLINGPTATYLGEGDLHDPRYDGMEVFADFLAWCDNPEHHHDEEHEEEEDDHGDHGHEDHQGECEYSLSVYPSRVLHDSYVSNQPAIFCTAVVLVFFFTSMVFLLYDCFVQRRQDHVMESAVRTDMIVSSLFPQSIQDRLFEDIAGGHKESTEMTEHSLSSKKSFTPNGKSRLKSYLGGDSEELDVESTPGCCASRPIADFFPETTVLFADIAGFTAWSSQREPSQVFMLLETLYGAFDKVAKRRGVFKVETIGDCYVAVTGLPEPRGDHAAVMAKFARDCITKMSTLTKKLEVTLGPDTGDLALRVGLHSGPVTAGVLRGEKSRFQLFGDTVNTASRMESTGRNNRIQISEATAECLKQNGKAAWLRPREDVQSPKGKGEMHTFWVEFKAESNLSGESNTQSTTSAESSSDPSMGTQELLMMHPSGTKVVTVSSKTRRLVEWNAEVLYKILVQVVEYRNNKDHGDIKAVQEPKLEQVSGQTVLEEANYCIDMPEFDPEKTAGASDTTTELDPRVKQQLRGYLLAVAKSYRDNPFHNFEHASHVAMSVTKLLSRVVAPDAIDYENETDQVASDLHNYTYGITSDPMIQFAAVFSAIIHDADHRGIPNAMLVDEDPKLAAAYKQKSVAEQNSVDVAWNILMQPCYQELRSAIYSTEAELKRFRQLVVVTVMATDIADKDLQSLRRKRWETAFSEESLGTKNVVNLKATIVLEHMIQASDVAHTMQHWHIYQKWNAMLFDEMYNAFKAGRIQSNPAQGWYRGEIGFFDFYIIPLAKKLKDCGVFGVSSDEYLNYAISNRQEWLSKGEEIVERLVQKHTSPKMSAA